MKKQESEQFKMSISAYIIPGLLPPKYTSMDILFLTSNAFGLKPSEITKKSRKYKFMQLRQIICLISSEKTNESLSEIGKTLNMSHSNVIYSINTVKFNIKLNYKKSAEIYNEINDLMLKRL